MGKILEKVYKITARLGPVAGSVQGELCRPETARAATKAFIVLIGTGASAAATVQDPDFQTNVLVPLGAAALTGLLDVGSRLHQGDPKPTPDPIVPPCSDSGDPPPPPPVPPLAPPPPPSVQ